MRTIARDLFRNFFGVTALVNTLNKPQMVVHTPNESLELRKRIKSLLRPMYSNTGIARSR